MLHTIIAVAWRAEEGWDGRGEGGEQAAEKEESEAKYITEKLSIQSCEAFQNNEDIAEEIESEKYRCKWKVCEETYETKKVYGFAAHQKYDPKCIK